jgi:hypothetical protein
MDAQGKRDAVKADWYDDPTGRHQFRYWDGAGWTGHVADDGKSSVDPIAPQTVPAAANAPGTPAADPGPSGQPGNKEFLKFFTDTYGLTRVGGGWSYNGTTNDALAQVDNPGLCLDVFRELRKRGEVFDHIAVLAANPSFIVLETKPPSGFATALSATAAADLIATVVKGTGQKAVTYEGVWILRLP